MAMMLAATGRDEDPPTDIGLLHNNNIHTLQSSVSGLIYTHHEKIYVQAVKMVNC